MWSLCWTACCCWNTATRTTPTKLLTGCPQPCTDITKYSQYSRWWKTQTEKIQKLCAVQSHKHYPQNVITSTIQYGILLLKIDPVLFFVLSFFPQIRGTWQDCSFRNHKTWAWVLGYRIKNWNQSSHPLVSAPATRPNGDPPPSRSLAKSVRAAQTGATAAARGSTLRKPHGQRHKSESHLNKLFTVDVQEHAVCSFSTPGRHESWKQLFLNINCKRS